MTSRLEKYFGKGEKIKVGEDEFELKPLDVEYLPHFFKVMGSLSSAKGIYDENCVDSIKILIEETLKRSMPEEPEELRKQFGLKYSGQILTAIFRMNGSEGVIDDKKSKQIDAIKQMIKKDGQSVPEHKE